MARGVIQPYTLTDLYRDTGSGHRIQQTVFVECCEAYRPEGPVALRSTGEVEFIAATAELAASDPRAPSTIAALVSHVDLTLGAEAESVIQQHVAARREQLFEQWQKDIAELARCEKVTVKLGGLALPIDGFAFMKRELPLTSDEFAQ